MIGKNLLRLIHTADWQLGREFGQFETDDAGLLAAARFDVIGRILQYANDQNASLIVVAGDVFDAPVIGDKMIRRVFNALDAFEGHWVLLPGNHDAALAAGVWVRARELACVGARTHVASQTGVINIDRIHTSVLVAPLTQRNTLSDTTGAFDQLVSPEGYFRIGVAHGSVGGVLPEASDAGNPIDPDRATSARLDYLALGDWHGKKMINERTWYSGTPEPDRFRANEPGYILNVTLTEPRAVPDVTPAHLAQYSWHDIELTLANDTDVEALEHALNAFGAGDVVRLKLTGTVSLAQQQQVDILVAAAAAKARALRNDQSELALGVSDEDIAKLQVDGYLTQVLTDLKDERTDLPDEIRQEALRLFADAIAQRNRQGL